MDTPGQNQDGTLQPPTAFEKTDIPLEGLSQAQQQPQQMPMQILSLDDSDRLRNDRAYKQKKEPLPEWLEESLNNIAHQFVDFLIENFKDGKDRSQAIGQIDAAVLWAKKGGLKKV